MCKSRLAVALIACLLLTTATRNARSAEVFVAPNGDDSHRGTKAKPFRTLERARDAARGLTATSERDGATIHLRGGVYPRSATFELDDRDSGSTYRPYRNEVVHIIGGIEIPNSAVQPVESEAILERIISEAARSRILRVDLGALGVTDYGEPGPRGFRRPYVPAPLEVFIDGQALTIAQWPNPGEPRVPMGKVLDKGSIPRTGDFSNRGGVFHYDSDRPNRWTEAADIWLYGLFNKGYADNMVKVARIDPSGRTFTTVQPTMYGYASGKPFQTWVAKNLLEEIDLPGEYFVDGESGTLYFLLRGGHGAFILHFDDGACGTRVFGNLFSRNEAYAIRMNGAVNNVIENNIFVDTKQDIRYGPWNGRRWYDAVRDPLHKKRLREDIDILKPPYSERYPDLVRIYNAPPEEPRPNLVRGNVSVRSNGLQKSCNSNLTENMITDEDPGFVDAEAGDFRLRDDSSVFRQIPGFEPIAMERTGLYDDSYRKAMAEDRQRSN